MKSKGQNEEMTGKRKRRERAFREPACGPAGRPKDNEEKDQKRNPPGPGRPGKGWERIKKGPSVDHSKIRPEEPEGPEAKIREG